MKLLRKLEAEPFVSLDVSGRREHVVSLDDSIPEGWEDISSIEEWYEYGEFSGADYKLIRSNISYAAYVKTLAHSNLDLLTEDEKDICAEMLAISAEFTIQRCPDDYLEVMEDWDVNSRHSRETRWQAARMTTFTLLATAKLLLKRIIDDKLDASYYQGIESKDVDGIEGIYDFLESGTGTSYENSGLLNSGEHVVIPGVPLDLNGVSAAIMSILKDGIYNLNTL